METFYAVKVDVLTDGSTVFDVVSLRDGHVAFDAPDEEAADRVCRQFNAILNREYGGTSA